MAKLVLRKGAYAGKTITLAGYKFVNGELPITGSIAAVEGVIRYLGLCYQAELEATPEELQDGERDIQTDAQPGSAAEISSKPGPDGKKLAEVPAGIVRGNDNPARGAERVLADGNGHQDAGIHPQESQILRALRLLDSANSEHWTKDGKPSCDAVATLMNSGNVTRAQIENALPGFRRKAT